MKRVTPRFVIERQKETQWCWATVASSLSKWRGIDVDQCAVVAAVTADPDTCSDPGSNNHPNSLALALKSVDLLLDAQAGTAPPLPLVQSQIDKNLPVCGRVVWDTNGDGLENEGAHFIVISGYGPYRAADGTVVTDGVEVGDPKTGLTRKCPLSEILESYLGSGIWVDTYFLKER